MRFSSVFPHVLSEAARLFVSVPASVLHPTVYVHDINVVASYLSKHDKRACKGVAWCE